MAENPDLRLIGALTALALAAQQGMLPPDSLTVLLRAFAYTHGVPNNATMNAICEHPTTMEYTRLLMTGIQYRQAATAAKQVSMGSLPESVVTGDTTH